MKKDCKYPNPPKRQPRCQTLASMKLTKKQLRDETEMIDYKNQIRLEIGQLTLDQLRVALYREQRQHKHYLELVSSIYTKIENEMF